MVKWQWAGDKDKKSGPTWVDYDAVISEKLEKTFSINGTKVKIDDERFVDLKDKDEIVQRRYDDPDKFRKVRRVADDGDDDRAKKSSKKAKRTASDDEDEEDTKPVKKTAIPVKKYSKSNNNNNNNNNDSEEDDEDDNHVEPDLTMADLANADSVILDILEGKHPDIPIALLFTDRKNPEKAERAVWRAVAKGIGRMKACKSAKAREQIKDEIVCTKGQLDLAEFIKMYNKHPRFPELDTSVSADVIQKALQQGKAKIVVYYRAVGRFPGGNCDDFIVKFTVNLEDQETTAVQWANWDGSSTFSTDLISIPSATDRFKKLTVPALRALATAQPCEGLNGKLTFTTTIAPICGSGTEDDDTDWTSIEMLVYLPKEQKDESKPALHIHQYANYSHGKPVKKQTYSKGGENSLKKVLDSLDNVFKMGRPQNYSEGNATSKLIKSRAKSGYIINFGYSQFPMYINL